MVAGGGACVQHVVVQEDCVEKLLNTSTGILREDTEALHSLIWNFEKKTGIQYFLRII